MAAVAIIILPGSFVTKLPLRRTGRGVAKRWCSIGRDDPTTAAPCMISLPPSHPIHVYIERERTSVTGVGDMNFDCSRDFEWRSLVMATCTILFGRATTGNVVVYNIINFNHGQNFKSLRSLARSSSLMRCWIDESPRTSFVWVASDEFEMPPPTH